MSQSYYVTAPGKLVMVFGGPHALKHALEFAVLARKCEVDDVRVGLGDGRDV